MKIVIINSSPRINGATAKILNIMKQHLESKSDVSVQYFNLSKKTISLCRGCCYCFEHGECFINDDAENIAHCISLADGIIIGSPTYLSNISGQLKIFLDRGHFVMEQLLYEKYAIGIITSENYGGNNAKKILQNIFLYSGAYVSAMLHKKLPFSTSPEFSSKEVTFYKKKAEHFYCNITDKHTYFIQHIIHKIVFSIGIKPFVLKKGDKYKGVRAHWKV